MRALGAMRLCSQRNSPKPSSTGRFSSSKRSYSVSFLAVIPSEWSYQTLAFDLMSCLKEMETWVIAGEGDLFEHMVVVIILISLQDHISLASNLRLQRSRLDSSQSSSNPFPTILDRESRVYS